MNVRAITLYDMRTSTLHVEDYEIMLPQGSDVHYWKTEVIMFIKTRWVLEP